MASTKKKKAKPARTTTKRATTAHREKPRAKAKPAAKGRPKKKPKARAKAATRAVSPRPAPAPKAVASPTIVVDSATIVHEELFDAAPMDVYEAIVDPAKHAAFTGGTATGEPVEGGAFTAWDGYIAGRHERLVPGARIVQLWRTTEFPAEHPDSRLELELRPAADGKTRLRMTHSGVPRTQAKGYERDWVEHYWQPLREYLRDTGWAS